METKDIWNLIVKDYKENYNQPERVVQGLWENYCTTYFRYNKNEIDAQRTIHIGSGMRTIPDIIIIQDNKDLLDIELKQYNYSFNDEMEKQLISYMDLLHLSIGVLVCKKLYLYVYDYAQKKIMRVAIDFVENNSDGIRFIELFTRQNFSQKTIETFITQKNNELAQIKEIQSEIQEGVTSEFLLDLLKDWFRADYGKEVLDKALLDFEITIRKKEQLKVVAKEKKQKIANTVETNAEYHRTKFWKIMERELCTLNNPFKIKPQYSNGKARHYAQIEKCKGINEDINFLAQEGILRICLYIYDRPGLYELFKQKKDLIANQLGYPVVFVIGGKTNNIQWVKREWNFIPNNEEDYERVLKKALPEMIRFVEIFKPYLQ